MFSSHCTSFINKIWLCNGYGKSGTFVVVSDWMYCTNFCRVNLTENGTRTLYFNDVCLFEWPFELLGFKCGYYSKMSKVWRSLLCLYVLYSRFGAWRLLYITYTRLKFASEIVIFIQDGKSKGAWTLCGNSEASDCNIKQYFDTLLCDFEHRITGLHQFVELVHWHMAKYK